MYKKNYFMKISNITNYIFIVSILDGTDLGLVIIYKLSHLLILHSL